MGIELSNGDEDELTYAQGRFASRTYTSRSFPLKRTNSPDDGQPARFVYKVFDPETELHVERTADEWILNETPGGRYQLKMLIAREARNIKELIVYRVPSNPEGPIETKFSLRAEQAIQLVDLVSVLGHIDPDGPEAVRVDDSVLREVFSSERSVRDVYSKFPAEIHQAIADSADAHDVIAVAARRAALEEFRRRLDDAAHFDAVKAEIGRGPEAVWQTFFEEHPWILGVTLASQLVTSWDDDRLEQVVAGYSIAGPGKRPDALMRTAGQIRQMVFVEFKTHRDPLLQGTSGREGCWGPSRHVTDGIAQVQGTVHRAVEDIGERIVGTDGDGADRPEDITYLIDPRSILLIGKLDDLISESGGHNRHKVRSFELFRRSLVRPEVITFDELLARAEWVVNSAAAYIKDDADQ